MDGDYDDEDDDAFDERVELYLDDAGREEAEAGSREDVEFDGGYKIPGTVWERLFEYQKTGVKWLWELHTQKAGGIIGDEMGLGKTIQVIAFLAGLHRSGKLGPSLVVAPATVLRQWLLEFRAWYPLFRVIILHDSMKHPLGARGTKEELLDKVLATPSGVVITTYEGLRLNRQLLLPVAWSYVVLDEGHKIRNPDAEVTLVCKQVATVHRIIMSGSPIQNRLQELWSLFDFVFPGKLGTLPVFHTQFAVPITIGGYTNASALQVSTAYQCAVTLRDLISPYLLRRRKDDVQAQLPSRKEQVLFCSLTPEQRDAYRSYLASKDVEEILSGSRHVLQGIDILRKICNHPDLVDRAFKQNASDYGCAESSGKLTVTHKVLAHWHAQGHKVLLFTQTQQMLDILESLAEREGYRYHRMDGSTSIGVRTRLINDFNRNASVFLFLLTTKVGGLGVNLTGANRVLLYDPDWNPSNDMQARERAWRIGQKRDVTIYRLITTGTIEEKVYHRQIYKQFLTNKVLSDPKQKRYFTAKHIRDLFTLEEAASSRTETERIFEGLRRGDDPLEDSLPLGRRGAGGGTTGRAAEDALGRPLNPSGSSTSLDPERSADGGPETGGTSEDVADNKILKDLMEGSGLRSALDHIKIEGATEQDKTVIEQEASRVAEQAARALRESRLDLQRSGRDVSAPTWTGRNGSVGAPRFGASRSSSGRIGIFGNHGTTAPSSSAVLARIRSRQQGESERDQTRTQRQSDDFICDVDDAQQLLSRIISFMESSGGRVKGTALVAAFQDGLPVEKMPLFRQLLKQVAILQRRRDDSYWLLKSQYRSGGND
uniref:DNA excision repair protein ERCC-6 n=2 Tax=Tetraselmis sp. GSL018 TaxID=582737 RepID=A0A061RWX5_9CHLO